MKKSIDSLQKKFEEARVRLETVVKSLPDVPGVQHINPRVAFVSSKLVASNGFILSPRYYLGQAARDALLEMIRHTTLETLPKRIDDVIKRGRIKGGDTLHPVIIEALRSAWEDGESLDAAAQEEAARDMYEHGLESE